MSIRTRRATTVGKLENFYPSPFFDVASNYLPRTLKETFEWCLYYQLTNPIINSVTSKLSTYPITDMVYEDDNPGVTAALREVLEDSLGLREFLVETNLDRYTYGNSFASVSFPIKKMLKCRQCGAEDSATRKSYVWKNYSFSISCDSCGYSGPAEVRDEPIKSPKKIKLIRWNPKHITIKTNEVTGDVAYFYEMPRLLRNGILLGKPEIVETVPQAFITACKKNKAIRIDSSKIYHSKRASVSRDPGDSGWGTPLILPVLKDIFFLQVLRKSQEAVAMEHIVPMRVLFPQVTTDGSNPYQHINLKDWQKEVTDQIGKWRRDINHMPVMPVPIGSQVIGGQGRSYLLHQEIRIYSEQIIAGMGVPTGFFYGEAMYSGASVNLRALENEFLGNRDDMLRLVNFVRDQVCLFLDLPKAKLSFKPFKMADDLQKAMFDFQLVSANMLSKKTFMQARDYDYDSEREMIEDELKDLNKDQSEQMKTQAEAQGEGTLISTKYQIKAQEMMGEAQMQAQQQQGAPEGGQQDPSQPPAEALGGQSQVTTSPAMAPVSEQAQQLASQLEGLDRVEKYKALTSLRRSNPELYMIVNEALNNQRVAQGRSGLKPLPSITLGGGS